MEGGTALAYKVIGNNKGDTVRNSYVENNPVVSRSTEYEALRVLATQTDENGDLYPVSYTHLDVYKRQSRGRV